MIDPRVEEFLCRLEKDDIVGDAMFFVAVICFIAAVISAGCGAT